MATIFLEQYLNFSSYDTAVHYLLQNRYPITSCRKVFKLNRLKPDWESPKDVGLKDKYFEVLLAFRLKLSWTFVTFAAPMVFRSLNIPFFHQIRESLKLREDKSSTGVVSVNPRSSVRVKNTYDDTGKCMLLLSLKVWCLLKHFYKLLMTMQEKQIFAREIEIQKRKMGQPNIFSEITKQQANMERFFHITH